MKHLMFILLMLAGCAGFAAEVSIAEDRMLVVDGERTFVLGLYENPSDDAVLKAAAEAGFNLVQSQADKASLDRLEEAGLWAWINTGGAIDLSEDRERRAEALEEMAKQFGEHPAMLVWEVPDEALWNNWYGATLWRTQEEPRQLRELLNATQDTALATRVREQMERAYGLRDVGNFAASEQLLDEAWKLLGKESPRAGYGWADAAARSDKMRGGMLEGYGMLRKLDPDHPVWMNHAPRNQIAQLAAYNEAADIVGCDIYPVPGAPYVGHSDLADQTASSVGAYTDRMQAAAPGKPVWMVLQGFGWADLQEDATEEDRKNERRPTLEETRFMAWDTIAHGARGILYWGTYRIEKDSQLWQDLLTVGKELSDLQEVLSAPERDLGIEAGYQETFGSIEWEPLVVAKDAPSGTWLLVVNENGDPLRVELGGLEELEGKKLADYYGAETAYTVEDGKLAVYVKRKGFVLLSPE